MVKPYYFTLFPNRPHCERIIERMYKHLSNDHNANAPFQTRIHTHTKISMNDEMSINHELKPFDLYSKFKNKRIRVSGFMITILCREKSNFAQH